MWSPFFRPCSLLGLEQRVACYVWLQHALFPPTMSFAPSELQKEIATLSSEIEAQKAILDDLIGRRSRAQRNLNAVLDPMARLPLELQSKIFLHCLCFDDDEEKNEDEDERASRPNSKLAPMVFSNVCQLWRDIALCTPELWTHLRMEGSPRGSNHFQLYEIWLERSRPLPVSLTLASTSILAEGVKHAIDRSARRVEEFSLLLSAGPRGRGDRMPRLPFQSLKRLVIVVGDQIPFYYVHHWIDLMRMSPGLLHCTFVAKFSHLDDTNGGKSDCFTLAALKELRLKERPSVFPVKVNPTKLLRYITLPALERLHIHCSITADSVSDFSAFILRSSPPLRSLAIESITAISTPIAEYLSAVPTLQTLTLATSDWVSVVERLATDPAFLPNLEHLTCTPRRTRSRGDFEIVICMLEVRSLRTFRLNDVFPIPFGGSSVAPDEDILVELRGIRYGGGIDIYVGDGKRNLV
ncbi:hypothetical protein R3P38DRAFT_1886018 [Favolaschia claudopus]|uniref:F-box domain-containing protein n=1 Tax=Favolaschia claudopus TaxID=2862362 RepID=A0AAW0DDN1_9AGAR